MNKPRIFVSSVMDSFTEYREAARGGIAAAGGQPILVEDYPSLTSAPRTACLNGVASSDALVVVIGSRGGWTTPSGKLAVEEEYEEARRRKLPILLFVESVPNRDDDAKSLVTRLSDYVEGHFRKTFSTAPELQELVSKSVSPLVEHKGAPMVDVTAFNNLLSDAPKRDSEAVLRFLLMPERSETFISSVEIGSDKFINELMALAHSSSVGLFSYERSKKSDLGVNEITLKQIGSDDRRDAIDEAHLIVTTTGTVIIDTNVTGRTRYSPTDGNTLGYLYSIVENDVTGRLAACFAFADGLYGTRDLFKRFDRFLYNVVLHNVGARILVAQIPNTTSVTVPQTISAPVVTFDTPQVLSREELADPAVQIDEILTLLRRRIKPRDWFGQSP